jgi:amidophosphoribosyltransferase
MKRVIREINPAIAGFEASCFDGCYIAGTLPQDQDRQPSKAGAAPGTGQLSLQCTKEESELQ